MCSELFYVLIRRILSSTEIRREEPGGDLRNVLAAEVCRIMLKNLPEILHKSHSLIPEGQVSSSSLSLGL